MEATKAQLKRLERDWTEYAKEEIKIQQVGSTFYAYGTEMACLRIFYCYRHTTHTRVQYSTNLKTWYFSLETNN